MPDMLLTASTVSCCKLKMRAEQTSQAGGMLFGTFLGSSATLHCIDLLHISVTTVQSLGNIFDATVCESRRTYKNFLP